MLTNTCQYLLHFWKMPIRYHKICQKVKVQVFHFNLQIADKWFYAQNLLMSESCLWPMVITAVGLLLGASTVLFCSTRHSVFSLILLSRSKIGKSDIIFLLSMYWCLKSNNLRCNKLVENPHNPDLSLNVLGAFSFKSVIRYKDILNSSNHIVSDY